MKIVKWIFFRQSDGGQYTDTLKPKYNSIDLTEVELPESESAHSSSNSHSKNGDGEDANMLLDVSDDNKYGYKLLLTKKKNSFRCATKWSSRKRVKWSFPF